MFLLQTTVSRLTHCTVYLMSTDLILNCEYVVDAGKRYEWEASQWGPNPRLGGARGAGVAPTLPLHGVVGVLPKRERRLVLLLFPGRKRCRTLAGDPLPFYSFNQKSN
ncbi:hypothetical protein MTP99_001311 [Tenebrio molitor]|jgi:hypothetical protein|uniref:Uncharacterized protein n=1 Tax=Tenebrio molitor TaxID=7067 RepID=A0A8J6HM84_TENMO|nr:hypothetical protein GEV33_006225 [Tenebrio molitor]KAJ3637892.1 hypothetical protein MTP99_001311 [Tenebrio molitor]